MIGRRGFIKALAITSALAVPVVRVAKGAWGTVQNWAVVTVTNPHPWDRVIAFSTLGGDVMRGAMDADNSTDKVEIPLKWEFSHLGVKTPPSAQDGAIVTMDQLMVYLKGTLPAACVVERVGGHTLEVHVPRGRLEEVRGHIENNRPIGILVNYKEIPWSRPQ